MIENVEQGLEHANRALDWIGCQQKDLEQKRIDYSILRAKFLTKR